MEKSGKVWLAGAGPGDAGLLTVRAKQLLEEADVIVYDALISAEILSQIPDEKELIHVGKRSGHHLVPQEGINEILLEEAKKGKKVLHRPIIRSLPSFYENYPGRVYTVKPIRINAEDRPS